MPRTATIDDLKRLLKPIALPALSAEAGEEVTMTIRRIHQREYISALPSLPPDADSWTSENAVQKEREWLASLSEDERAEKVNDALRSTYRIVALGVVSPELTWRQAAVLAGDADVLALAILKHSGLLRERTHEESAPSESEAAPVAA